jgi:hypothetical protein
MDINKKYQKVLVGIIIIIVAIIVAEIRKKQILQQNEKGISSWPKFVAIDISGRSINGDQFRKRIRYVQFISMLDENNISLLERICAEWGDKIDIFVIAKRSIDSMEILKRNILGAVIIQDGFEELTKIFKNTKYGKHYLFDKDGINVFSSDNNISYGNGIKRYLKYVVERKQFNISDFIKQKSNINITDEYGQIKAIIKNIKGEYLFVGMVYSFCETCYSGWLIDKLKEINSLGNNVIDIVLIISKEFTEKDANTMSSQLGIKYPIVIADLPLSNKWEKLINEYSGFDLNSMAFVINRRGIVERALDTSCNKCGESFWDWVDKALKKGR